MASDRPPRRAFLAPFPVLAAVMGLGYLVGDEGRTAAHTFRIVKYLLPMDAWGSIFLLGAVALTAALISNRRGAITAALFFGAVTYTWWSLALLITTLVDPGASANAWAAYGFIAFTHYYATWRVWTGS